MACGLVFRGTHEISLTNNPLLYTTVFENHQKCLVLVSNHAILWFKLNWNKQLTWPKKRLCVFTQRRLRIYLFTNKPCGKLPCVNHIIKTHIYLCCSDTVLLLEYIDPSFILKVVLHPPLFVFQECINRMSNSNSPGSIVREGYFESISPPTEPPRLQDEAQNGKNGKPKIGYIPRENSSTFHFLLRQVWNEVFHLCDIHLLLWFSNCLTYNIFVEKIYSRGWIGQLWYLYSRRTADTTSSKLT